MKPETKGWLRFALETIAGVITIATVILVVAAIISGLWQYPG